VLKLGSFDISVEVDGQHQIFILKVGTSLISQAQGVRFSSYNPTALFKFSM
jgi:hypothetical protein